MFDPEQVVAMVKQDAASSGKLLLPKEECIKQYLDVSPYVRSYP